MYMYTQYKIIYCQFSKTEDAVRRKTYNIPAVGITQDGKHVIQRMRGLEMLPDRADFGILREGNTYRLATSRYTATRAMTYIV